jgi:alpha-D-ribose 1-methylphosphonate 5-triphosphate diphosphatase
VLCADQHIRPALVEVHNGQIQSVSEPGLSPTWDLGHLLLLPGLIDLHGDAFERQWMPRSGVFFPLDIALIDSDRQILSNGISTAYHGLTVSWEPGLRGIEHGRLMVDSLSRLRSQLLADTRLHLRYETYSLNEVPEILDWIASGQVHLIGFNDHLQMIARNLDHPHKGAKYAERSGISLPHFRTLLHNTLARQSEVPAAIARIAQLAVEMGLPLASHDDETPEMRAQYAALGSRICEFPLDLPTAQSAIDSGHDVILGGPNVVRGQSHANRMTATDAIRAGLGTVLSTDYFYPSLLHAIFRLVRDGILPLPQAWALGSANAARAAALNDRGHIAPGLRADFTIIDDSNPTLPRVVATLVAGRVAFLSDPNGSIRQ